MIVTYYEQGSEDWNNSRCTIPTVSQFSKIVTTKGTKSTQWKQYLYTLAAGKFTDNSTNIDSEWVSRGVELEPEARASYEFLTDFDAHEVGIIYKDENRNVGASPDGLVESDIGLIGLEIKCPAPHTHIQYLMDKKLPSSYFQQVQGSLWVTGLPAWDFFSYHPDMPPFMLRVEPDKEFHKTLDKYVPMFIAELNKTINTVKEAA